MTTSTEIATDLSVSETVVDPTPDVPKVRHIVNPPLNLHIFKPGMTSQDVVDIARVKRLEVEALCGLRFVPSRNPEGMNTCCECVDVMSNILGR